MKNIDSLGISLSYRVLVLLRWTVGPGFLLLSSDPLYSVGLVRPVTLGRWVVVCS